MPKKKGPLARISRWMSRRVWLLALPGLLTLGSAPPAAAGEILTTIRSRDLLRCGVTSPAFPSGTPRASGSECRRAQDAKRDIPVPLSPCARRQPCGPGRPAPGHGAVTTSPLRGRSDSAMTRRRMARRRVGCALHPASTAPGPAAPAPLRRHARADAFRGLPACASLSMAGSGSNSVSVYEHTGLDT